MYEYSDKRQMNSLPISKQDSEVVANYIVQKKGSVKQDVDWTDNRSEAILQRKLKELAATSPHVNQAVQLQDMADNYAAQRQLITQCKPSPAPIQKKNNTGLPDNLKAGIENLSGYSMDDVNVHYHSEKPAQLQAHAYAQGTDIHLASGQEKHLPHEAWHVVQQKQGRVKPTMQMKGGVNVNDDKGLEKEADVMGRKALHVSLGKGSPNRIQPYILPNVAQRIQEGQLSPVSEHQSYMLSKQNSHILYSMLLSREPSPKGLYIKNVENVTGGDFDFSVNKWTPNVRFFSKEEQVGLVTAHDENKRTNPDHPNGLAGLWSKFKGKSAREVGADEINRAWNQMIKIEENSIENGMALGAKLGILGNNDCAAFARTLYELIKVEKEEERRKDVDEFGELAGGERSCDEPVPGTFIQHKFPEKTNGCGYHGVTVVAKDGATLVTLEAHAGKKKLKVPEFHMRNGINGFIADNTPAGLSSEDKRRWEMSSIKMKHPDKASELKLGGSLEEDIAAYTELDAKESPTSRDLGFRMMKIGVTKK
ncbi:MAG: DUF4157 domain-containing protein [Bacteroidota bacterium]